MGDIVQHDIVAGMMSTSAKHWEPCKTAKVGGRKRYVRL